MMIAASKLFLMSYNKTVIAAVPTVLWITTQLGGLRFLIHTYMSMKL